MLSLLYTTKQNQKKKNRWLNLFHLQKEMLHLYLHYLKPSMADKESLVKWPISYNVLLVYINQLEIVVINPIPQALLCPRLPVEVIFMQVTQVWVIVWAIDSPITKAVLWAVQWALVPNQTLHQVIAAALMEAIYPVVMEDLIQVNKVLKLCLLLAPVVWVNPLYSMLYKTLQDNMGKTR